MTERNREGIIFGKKDPTSLERIGHHINRLYREVAQMKSIDFVYPGPFAGPTVITLGFAKPNQPWGKGLLDRKYTKLAFECVCSVVGFALTVSLIRSSGPTIFTAISAVPAFPGRFGQVTTLVQNPGREDVLANQNDNAFFYITCSGGTFEDLYIEASYEEFVPYNAQGV